MKALLARLFKPYKRKEIELEVEEELRFHVEMLRREYIRQGMPPEEAKGATLKRFGDVEQIKYRCVQISRRSHPFMRALKSFLILVSIAGVSVRVLSADISVGRIGEMLIAVAVLSRLLLYVRGLSPSNFLSKNRNTFAADL
ncbi:MAG TPA: permease prefix domain 1-containing protein [Pyrinomonadaceae bacterium]|nr:permease prefix domain 1-containing protein [Pyrinomonadaceae bacterium]